MIPRFFQGEFRIEGTSEAPKIVGYAAVFNTLSEDLGGFREKIEPGAFAEALAKNDDIMALMYHDPKLILGRRSRGTLTIREDQQGLYVEIVPPNTTVGRDAIENVRRGDVSGMSFHMNKVRDNWVKGDGVVRTVRSIGVMREVTLTTIPAYKATSVSLRAHEEDELEYVRQRIAETLATPGRDALAKRLGY